jgi:UDP:flavonoid glycosyltransferase YjiC (YdhE family)
MKKLDKDKPVIYFTLGTSGSFEHFMDIMETLSTKGYQTVVSTGGENISQKLPKDVYSADFVPALKIMDKVDIVVSSGGNGTIYQALSKGVPIIGYPTFYDQEWNSERLEQLNLGKRLSLKGFNTDQLIKAVRNLTMDKKVKENCQHFKRLISKYDAAKNSADLIEDCFS